MTEQSFFVVASAAWVFDSPTHEKRLAKQQLCPLGCSAAHLEPGCTVSIKFRESSSGLIVDPEGRLESVKEAFFLKSQPLASWLTKSIDREGLVLFFFEGTRSDARCVIEAVPADTFARLELEDPTLRMAAYDLPPATAARVSGGRILRALYDDRSRRDPEMYAVHASGFLNGPHILVPLFAHVLSLRSEDHVRFPIVLKKIAEWLRIFLQDHTKSVAIKQVAKSHADFWPRTHGKRIAFLDGGVARIPSIAHLEPMALRVGIYDVAPGERELSQREQWSLHPFVIGDIVAGPPHGIREDTDRKRLQEAARYVLEPLMGLAHMSRHHSTDFLFLHGPLANQFAMYDELEPNNLPSLSPSFLASWGITEALVKAEVHDLPVDQRGEPLWNQFMAVYGYVMRQVACYARPMVGVVERPLGRPVTHAVLDALEEDRVINRAARNEVEEILARYDISDDFLFGCVLRDGEALTPLSITKTNVRRAHDRWRPVVAQYPRVSAALVKTEAGHFPFRIEMNDAAAAQFGMVVDLLYHTAKLLPRYAFPAGLDIADKYAKIPDWLSRGVSAELSGVILRRALRTGDPHLVAQVRQLLARGSRDFFFRPGIN